MVDDPADLCSEVSLCQRSTPRLGPEPMEVRRPEVSPGRRNFLKKAQAGDETQADRSKREMIMP